MDTCQETYHISLGYDCSIAYQLQKKGLRTKAFPFDWCLVPNIYSVIQDDFNQFFNFRFKNKSKNFPVIKNKWVDREMNKETIRVVNTYGVHFVHDFLLDYDLDEIICKYKRRINRFYDIMKSNCQKKLYRLTKKKDECLEKLFYSKGFINFDIKYIYFQDLPLCKSWKKKEVDLLSF